MVWFQIWRIVESKILFLQILQESSSTKTFNGTVSSFSEQVGLFVIDPCPMEVLIAQHRTNSAGVQVYRLWIAGVIFFIAKGKSP